MDNSIIVSNYNVSKKPETLPDNLFWGRPCKYKHNEKGKNLRYKSNNVCLACAKSHSQKKERDTRSLDAMNYCEQKKELKDLDEF